jgi:hypothetical protein
VQEVILNRAPIHAIRRDTPAWILQVWAAFATACALCTIGVWNMPTAGMERGLLAVGMLFCLSSTLGLAKTVRDNRDVQVDTSAWVFQVWAAFTLSNLLTAWGLYRMDTVQAWQKWFLVSGWLFLVSSAFTLAKTIRDNHEAVGEV